MRIELVCITETGPVVLASSEVVGEDGQPPSTCETSYLRPHLTTILGLPAKISERAALLCAVMVGEFLPFGGSSENLMSRMRDVYRTVSGRPVVEHSPRLIAQLELDDVRRQKFFADLDDAEQARDAARAP